MSIPFVNAPLPSRLRCLLLLLIVLLQLKAAVLVVTSFQASHSRQVAFSAESLNSPPNLIVADVSSQGPNMDSRQLIPTPVQVDVGQTPLATSSELIVRLILILLSGIAAVCLLWIATRPVYKLHQEATRDGLTGALNRKEFMNRASSLATTPELIDRRSTDKTIVAVLDLDGFKIINDKAGHDAGDAVLCAVVERLTDALAEDALIGRLGGDEFVVSTVVPTGVNIAFFLEDLRHAIVSDPVTTMQGNHRFGVTIGFTTLDAHNGLRQALSCADQALIAGKAISKNACYPAIGDKQPTLRINSGTRALVVPQRDTSAA